MGQANGTTEPHNFDRIADAKARLNTPVPNVDNTVDNTTTIATSSDLIFGLPEIISGNILGHDFTVNQKMNAQILELIPGKLEYDGASQDIVNAWKFLDETSKWEGYLAKVLQDANLATLISKMPTSPTKFAVQDFTAQESVQNEYGDSFLQSANDMASNLVKDFAYLSGGNADNFGSMIKNNIRGMIGDSAADSLVSGIKRAGAGIDSITGGKASDAVDAIKGSTAGKLLEGYRVDLPKIWKNTQNVKNYTLKIKLNASMDNPKAIADRVLLPYATLLTYASAQSDQGYLYKWPFVVRAQLPGYFEIPAGAITDMQISKPGDDKIISNRGKYLNIDITLTIMPLYSTQFLLAPGAAIPESMLTVSKEISSIAKRLVFEEGLD